VAQTIVCNNCGSKIAVTRDRCPKCRSHVVKVNAAAETARSNRLALGSGIVLALCVLGLGLLWMTQGTQPGPPLTVKPSDPLAARRQARPAESAQPGPAAPDLEKPRAFMEPAADAAVSYSAGDYQSALSQFEAAIAKNPQDAESFSNLGQVLVKLERTAEAIPHFQRACSLNPGRWAYRFNLARAFGLLQQWDESVASYRQAQQQFPDDYVTTFNLALTLHKKGDEAAAIEEYKKAVALNPEEASFRMALAISYEALQQRQDAASAYAEYLRLSPSAPDADKVRARIALLTGQPASAIGTPGL
jgi:tetratricopeptide (TPR) repeat protein